MAFGKKKEDIFFTLFKDYSKKLSEMSEKFAEFIDSYPSGDYTVELKNMESLCDSKKHGIISELNDSFVTPFDREDIFTIAGQLDDIADFMEDIVNKFSIYNISYMPDAAKELGRIIVKLVAEVDRLFNVLPESQKSGEARDAIICINDLEDQGDIIFRKALADLFRNEKDAIEIIKWNEMYEMLEDAIDSAENLADTVEGILTKNA